MSWLYELLFGCWHGHTSFPLTADRKRGAYVVCLDCGKEFPYDWTRMKIGRAA
jgi:hypothetical protein